MCCLGGGVLNGGGHQRRLLWPNIRPIAILYRPLWEQFCQIFEHPGWNRTELTLGSLGSFVKMGSLIFYLMIQMMMKMMMSMMTTCDCLQHTHHHHQPFLGGSSTAQMEKPPRFVVVLSESCLVLCRIVIQCLYCIIYTTQLRWESLALLFV